jgi:DNA repair protein RecO
MARTSTCEAIVLRTVDIGEADRFCILFTRERGRLAARARGVRKLGSRIGGTLLPLSHLRVDVTQTDHSSLITGASCLHAHGSEYGDFRAFAKIEQGIELVLRFTEDEEPLPQLFDVLSAYLHAAALPECDPFVPFTFMLLHLLGFLPLDAEDRRFARLSHEGRAYERACTHSLTVDMLCSAPAHPAELETFRDALLEEHLLQPLKAAAM